MFANDLLESFQYYPLDIDIVNSWSNAIKTSHKFELGPEPEHTKIRDISRGYYDTEILKKLPYDYVLIHYKPMLMDGTAFDRCNLFFYEGKNINILSFSKAKGEQTYAPYPYKFTSFGNSKCVYQVLYDIIEMLPEERKDIVIAQAQQPDEMIQGIMRTEQNILYNLLLLLNCKNVQFVKHDYSDKIQNKRMRKGELPLFSYHTLHLKSFKNIHNDEKVSLGDHNRVHFCRGHFKQFYPNKPLFGRHTGLFWWEPHLRGKGVGFVDKNYAL
jgi:hypothetical protein